MLWFGKSSESFGKRFGKGMEFLCFQSVRTMEIAVIFFLNDTKLMATGGTFEHETKQIWSVFT